VARNSGIQSIIMPSQTLLRNALSLSRRLSSSTRTTTSLRVFSTAPQEQHESESFLTGTSSIYAEQMYENYLRDPNLVEESWRRYFDNLSKGVPFCEEEYNQPTAVPPSKASRRQAPQAAVR
jgi:2-oxoglutarate dehydrogenase E1 component